MGDSRIRASAGEGCPQPGLDARDVHGRPGSCQVGVARQDRLMDGLVLGERALKRPRLRHAAPHPGPRGRQRHVVDERGEHRVARAQGDLLVEFQVGGNEVVDGGAVPRRRGVQYLARSPALLLRCHPQRREPGGRRLEDAAHLEELETRCRHDGSRR